MLFERKKLGDLVESHPELLKRGDWKCVNIDNRMSWPTDPQPFDFEGERVWVMPVTTDHYPGLAINRPQALTEDDTWALLHRALSALAWMQNEGASVLYRSGGSMPHMMGLGATAAIIRGSFDLSDFSGPTEDRERLALALIREGRSLDHPAFAFLSFYKVIETAIPDGVERGSWIAEKIPTLGGRAKEAVEALKAQGIPDIGRHLYKSGRHAIAHAQGTPTINPDDPRDFQRLHREMPIIEALAQHAIEERLGIKTKHTIWREHLYELRGWKKILGDENVRVISSGEVPAVNVDLPTINVGLRQSDPFVPLQQMQPIHAGVVGQSLQLVYEGKDKLIRFFILLDFNSERLRFDPQDGLEIIDDGSPHAARNAAALERFMRDYFGNGELHISHAESLDLISRCDAFIPVNVIINHDAWNVKIAEWEQRANDREAS